MLDLCARGLETFFEVLLKCANCDVELPLQSGDNKLFKAVFADGVEFSVGSEFLFDVLCGAFYEERVYGFSVDEEDGLWFCFGDADGEVEGVSADSASFSDLLCLGGGGGFFGAGLVDFVVCAHFFGAHMVYVRVPGGREA